MIWELGGGRRLDFQARPQLMGVVNVTPDSFYDGGRYNDPHTAVERVLEIVDEGADVVDIGGESSRPPIYGEANPVSVDEECKRVLPVVEAVRRRSPVAVSIDTTKAEVARRAIDAGADIINDISALDDGDMAEVCASSGAPIILMHRRGTPATMQLDTHYDDLLGEVRSFLQERIDTARGAGISPNSIAIDPGLGFGKSIEGNFALIKHLSVFCGLGYPVVVGASRKSFTWKPFGLSPEQGLEGSLAVAVLAVAGGANVIRTHDVGATLRAVGVAKAP